MSARRKEFAEAGVEPVFVHMSSETEARPVFERFGAAEFPRVSDPGRVLYAAFGARRYSVLRMLHPLSIARGVALIARGFPNGRPMGDVMQAGGAFLLRGNEVVAGGPLASMHDRPDYDGLMRLG